ncbi:MAG: bifunctional methylenetetrahydrofolate dehydrogenase/methenyltetrahydrofolate cyclohydrolase FolD [Clostridia bacterium]|nr:bifunctional methylenetetrahydrofolate dehydrogenase/methenyltetrahydrofolate cyclohydrolase FolD [Clostridia bacterium]
MANIIDGKKISADIRGEIAAEVAEMKNNGTTPGLAVIIVGENPASKVYVRNKGKGCAEVGMYSEIIEMAEETSEKTLIAKINELNERSDIHGILVQLPLPKHINERAVIEAIDPKKDVDAFAPVNIGEMMLGTADFLPCTPAGIMELLKRSGVSVEGKDCVVIGRSNIVGKPIAQLLLAANGTVTICHSRTRDLAEVTRRADILVVAIGKADFVTGDMVKDGVVVIDVGMNRKADGKLTGDVDYASVAPKASYITPVPGGVGPMTITMLLRNTLTAAKKQSK